MTMRILALALCLSISQALAAPAGEIVSLVGKGEYRAVRRPRLVSCPGQTRARRRQLRAHRGHGGEDGGPARRPHAVHAARRGDGAGEEPGGIHRRQVDRGHGEGNRALPDEDAGKGIRGRHALGPGRHPRHGMGDRRGRGALRGHRGRGRGARLQRARRGDRPARRAGHPREGKGAAEAPHPERPRTRAVGERLHGGNGPIPRTESRARRRRRCLPRRDRQGRRCGRSGFGARAREDPRRSHGPHLRHGASSLGRSRALLRRYRRSARDSCRGGPPIPERKANGCVHRLGRPFRGPLRPRPRGRRTRAGESARHARVPARRGRRGKAGRRLLRRPRRVLARDADRSRRTGAAGMAGRASRRKEETSSVRAALSPRRLRSASGRSFSASAVRSRRARANSPRR